MGGKINVQRSRCDLTWGVIRVGIMKKDYFYRPVRIPYHLFFSWITCRKRIPHNTRAG
jgi:hypothetical protein